MSISKYSNYTTGACFEDWSLCQYLVYRNKLYCYSDGKIFWSNNCTKNNYWHTPTTESQKFIAEKLTVTHNAVLKYFSRKSSGRTTCGKKMDHQQKGDQRLEKIAKNRCFDNVGEMYKKWTLSRVGELNITIDRRLH